MTKPTENIVRDHYKEHVDKSYFPNILDFMKSGEVVCMVWEGLDVVQNCRNLLGATDPSLAAPGTIRADHGTSIDRNVCHGSDSLESAAREIDIWFPPSSQNNHPSISFNDM